ARYRHACAARPGLPNYSMTCYGGVDGKSSKVLEDAWTLTMQSGVVYGDTQQFNGSWSQAIANYSAPRPGPRVDHWMIPLRGKLGVMRSVTSASTSVSAEPKEPSFSVHHGFHPAPASSHYCRAECESRRPQLYSAGACSLRGTYPSGVHDIVARRAQLAGDAGGIHGRAMQPVASDRPMERSCPPAHGCGTTELELSEVSNRMFENSSSSKLEQHIGWPIGIATSAAAATAAAITNAMFTRRDNLQAKAAATVAPMAAEAEEAGRGWGHPGELLHRCTKQSGTYDISDPGAEDDDISSLLQPGGSPCLPLEAGWALSSVAQREARGGAVCDSQASGAGRWLHRPVSASSSRCSSSSCSSDDLCEGMDISGPDGPASGATGGGGGHGEQLGQDRPRRAPPPPLPRRRARLLGYTDSAPAHCSNAAAAAPATREVTMAFLLGQQTMAVRRHVPGTSTLSAPPGVTAAAAAASSSSQKPFTPTETAPPVTAVALGCRVVESSAAEGEAPSGDEMRLLPGRNAVQLVVEKSCGMAAVARGLPPPPLPPRSSTTSRSIKPPSAGLLSRRALMVAAAAMAAAAAGAPPQPIPRLLPSGSRIAAAGSSFFHSCAAGSTFSNISMKEGSDGGGLLSSVLADGLTSLIEGLAAAAGGDGGMLRGCRASGDCGTELSRDRDPRGLSGGERGRDDGCGSGSGKSVRTRRFGRGLLACFTGH
ncbi:hypothetical protein VOLCADRAFT_93970, partial [Volvox carteri f. nagariensis]